MGSSEQHYSLRWNDYTVKIVTAFQSLRDEEDFVDVTIACDNHHYSAHKMVLSACSPYFRSLLRANPCQHPIVILKDVGHLEMERLLEFMYNGEVNIAQDHLAAFLKTAETLKIRGLAGSSEDMDQIHRDGIHNFSACYTGTTSTPGITSGRNSPSVCFAPLQDKDDDITETSFTSQTSSPSCKRRKGSSGTSIPNNTENSTSQTETLSGEGLLEGSDRAGSSTGNGGLDLEDDPNSERRELKSEPSDPLGEVYTHSSAIGSDLNSSDGLESRQIALAGPSGSTTVQDGITSQHTGDVSALMAIANAVQATAPSDRPIKCPLCQSIIKQARNLRRHVFKRHLPAAQRGEITEADVKNVLERKLKAITVTPLTEEELRQVQQRTRRKGVKTPRKMKGVAALPSDVNGSNINESEITIRKLPQKKDKKDKSLLNLTTLTQGILAPGEGPGHEDILQEALAARDKDPEPQEEVMDLATSQQQLPPISVVVTHATHTGGVPGDTQPVSLTVSQSTSAGHSRVPSETALQTGIRIQTDSPIALHRDLATMPPMAFEPQVSISESMTTYHTSSPSQVLPQSSSPAPSVAGYIPGSYWSTPSMAGLPTTTFQPHQSVFPAHPEYFSSVHMVRPPIDRMPQRRKNF